MASVQQQSRDFLAEVLEQARKVKEKCGGNVGNLMQVWKVDGDLASNIEGFKDCARWYAYSAEITSGGADGNRTSGATGGGNFSAEPVCIAFPSNIQGLGALLTDFGTNKTLEKIEIANLVEFSGKIVASSVIAFEKCQICSSTQTFQGDEISIISFKFQKVENKMFRFDDSGTKTGVDGGYFIDFATGTSGQLK